MKKWSIRAAGSALVLGLLFWFLPFDAIVDGFSRVPLTLMPWVIALFMLGHVVAAGKWWLLLERGLPFPLALQAHFAGLAANLCLPGAAGGDAVRATLGFAAMRDGPKLAAGSVADRMIDTMGLALLSVVGLVLVRGTGVSGGAAIQATVLVLLIGIAAMFVFPQLIVRLWTAFPKLPARSLAIKVAEAFGALGKKPLLLLSALALSMAVQLLFIWLAVQLAEAVGINLPFAAWVFAWPLAKIIAVLPISLGGLGVREASLAALLVPFGADAAMVVASGLVWQAVLYVSGAIGATVLALSGVRLRGAKVDLNK